MSGRFSGRRPGKRWDAAALDATLGKLTGKRMRDAAHFVVGDAVVPVVDLVDTPRKKPVLAVAQMYPLVGLCRGAGLPEPVPEYVFHPVRKWQFDYAFPLHKIAVEIEGGIWKKGGGAHSRPSNIIRDIEKYNAAVLLGWRVLRFVPQEMHHALPALRILVDATALV